MTDQKWKTLDTQAQVRDAARQKREQTTMANVGAFAVPFGGTATAPLRRGMIVPPEEPKKKKRK